MIFWPFLSIKMPCNIYLVTFIMFKVLKMENVFEYMVQSFGVYVSIK